MYRIYYLRLVGRNENPKWYEHTTDTSKAHVIHMLDNHEANHGVCVSYTDSMFLVSVICESFSRKQK